MADRIRLATNACPCGLPFRLIDSIEGRTTTCSSYPEQMAAQFGSTRSCFIRSLTCLMPPDGKYANKSGALNCWSRLPVPAWIQPESNTQSRPVVDFTDPTRPRTVAWSDPPPLDPANFMLGSEWGSYWYRGLIFESNITEGVNLFRLSDRRTAGARRLPFLNPQTQLGPVH